jgi:hypothetical protein
MSSTGMADLPNVAEVLSAVLQRIPRDQQPLLIAYAERLAAERYRAWAKDPANAPWKGELLACASREEEIASRIEGLHPEAEAIQRSILADNPDLEQINRNLFSGRPLAEQLAIQAQGERLGAATWRAFAAHASEPSQRSVFLGCAELEEQSAAVLETILTGAGAVGEPPREKESGER